ncbi:hypothetical protein BOX15_Mlig015905g1 [Macrostomum lignano]|uniref:Calponin-homology (CH) domain-containing protein n=1 Tax=Macrostomum lignano TaxID=282301 RepID=A0A267EZS9_9PLAT|nr:hypothetical protein BOX15_Mlig015905g1 [Macrostomum lignano]
MQRRQSFMSNVKNLRDEQERVQKKTFTNWINTYLIQCQPPCKIADLFPEVKDGIKLLLLLEVLSGQKLPHESRKVMQRVHCLSNVRTALSFLESKKIKLVNINPADIVDGKPSIVLGLIWTIILYFQIEEQEDTIMKSLEGTELAERGEKFKGSAKKALLAWAQNNLGDKYAIDIRDFGNSWRDGSAFNAMVHNIDPSLVDMEKLGDRTNRENLEAAFAAAESGLNIPRLIDPEDVDVDKPDEKSIMTYVAQFLKAYPEGSKKKPKLLEQVEAAKQAAEQERNDLRKISDFCEAVERELPTSGKGRGDPVENYKKFEEFRQQQAALKEAYEALLKRRADGHLLTLKPDEVDALEAQWRAASDQLNEWRWQLDSALPGDLGKVGGWLARAERCLREPFPDTAAGEPDEAIAQALHQRLTEHRAIFADAPAMRKAFQEARKSAGRGLPAEQLADIDRRLTQVQQDEPEVRQKLEFLESKYRVLAYFIVTERKLPEWTGNYGHLPEVEALLADYDNFVVAGKLLPSVDQALDSFRQQAEALKKRDSGKSMPETRENDRFATEATRKWDRLRREVQAAPEPLKRIAESWKQFLDEAEAIESWLPSAQAALRGSAEERDSFFADFANWEARHRRLNDAGGLLTANCAPAAADEVRQRLQRINRQWKELSEGHKQSERMDAAEKSRKGYHASTTALTDWLDRAKQLVEAELPCNVRCIRENLASLQATQDQQEPMEAEFKSVSKTAQSMVKDLPEQTVNEMLGNLKIIKDRLQNLRKRLPERSRGLKSVLPNVESLENGLEELVSWIEAGERLLAQHGGDSEDKTIEEKIEAHKTHFGQTNYFKSVLDGKNRFLTKIKSSKVKNLNTDEVDAQFEDLNRRFKALLSRAEQEAQDMQAAQSSLKLAKDWLRTAGDRLEPLTSTEAGDKASLASRLDRLNDLINSEEEGAARIQAAMEAVRRAMSGASPAQRAKLQAELDELQRAWDAHRERAQQAKADLEDTLDRLGRAEALETDLAAQLAAMESRGREAGGAKNSLDEKRDQVEALQRLLDDVQSMEPDLNNLDSSSQPQLQSRLRSLAKATEASAEKAAAAAADHEAYQQELEQLTADIDELEDEARDLDTAGTADDLEAKQRLAEELAQRRSELYSKLQSLNAAAEKVCSASGAAGRDRVRGEVRGLKNRLDGLVDQLTTRRKQLEQSANQWRGLGEQLEQMSAWLQEKQAQLDDCSQPRDTLEEKKEQLIDARGLHNEVAAFGKRLQSAEDRLRGMASQGLSGSPDQERQLEEIKFSHESLLAAAKEAAAEADEAVRDHAEFKEACTDAGNWISGLGERLAVCSDLTGDRQALQSRLDRLDDLSRAQAEGEQRLDKVDSLAEAVCRRTGSSGVDAIQAEAGDLRVEWTDFVDSVEQAKRDLSDCADRWAEYEEAHKLCTEHVRTAEAHLKAAEPRPNAEEKSALADRLSDAAAWADEVAERDFNGRLHDAAADVAKASREGHVTGQAASLTGRFSLLRDQLSDQAAVWRGHAEDHGQLDREMADVDDWLADFEDRLGQCGDGRGDRFEIQARLATLAELNAEREDGFRRLAALQDRLQSTVLPATSGAGRDRLRQAAQQLQDRWDSCLADLGRSRQQLDGSCAMDSVRGGLRPGRALAS